MKTHTNTNALAPAGPAVFPKLYGSVKVGERGQVVVPQEARVELGLRAGDKLLALGGFSGVQTVVLIKEESFGTILAEVSRRMSVLERLMREAGVPSGGRAGADGAGSSALASPRAAVKRRSAARRESGPNGRSHS